VAALQFERLRRILFGEHVVSARPHAAERLLYLSFLVVQFLPLPRPLYPKFRNIDP
jgi:hypothetical protein